MTTATVEQDQPVSPPVGPQIATVATLGLITAATVQAVENMIASFDLHDVLTSIAGVIAAGCLTAALRADLTFKLPDFRSYADGGPGRPIDDHARILSNLQTVVTESSAAKLDPSPRLLRIAHSEPADSFRSGVRRGMRSRGIDSYRWQLDADPCPLCLSLAANTHPVSEHPISHPWCGCTTVPDETEPLEPNRPPDRNPS